MTGTYWRVALCLAAAAAVDVVMADAEARGREAAAVLAPVARRRDLCRLDLRPFIPSEGFAFREDCVVNWRSARSMFGLTPRRLTMRESTAPAGAALPSRPRRREFRPRHNHERTNL